MPDVRAYFRVDVGYLENPKVAPLTARAVILHLSSMAYAAQHLTDGIIPVRHLMRRCGARKADADALFAAGLWHDLGDDEAEVHDYLEHNRSRADAQRLTDASRKANGVRWSRTTGLRTASEPDSESDP